MLEESVLLEEHEGEGGNGVKGNVAEYKDEEVERGREVDESREHDMCVETTPMGVQGREKRRRFPKDYIQCEEGEEGWLMSK